MRAWFHCSIIPKFKSASLLRNFLALWLRCVRRGSFRLDHAHFLFVFLKQSGAADFAGFLLAREPRPHFLGKIKSSAHLAFASGSRLSQLLHGLTHLAA